MAYWRIQRAVLKLTSSPIRTSADRRATLRASRFGPPFAVVILATAPEHALQAVSNCCETPRGRDPISLFDAYLRTQGMLDDAELKTLETDVANDIDWAVAEAEKGGWEPVLRSTRDALAASARSASPCH